MQAKHTLPLSLLLSLSSACGLVNVNGKPLGGGASTSAPTRAEPTASSEPTQASPGSHGWETPEAYEARQQKIYADQAAHEKASKAGRPTWCDAYSIGNSKDVDLADFANAGKGDDQPGSNWKQTGVKFAEVMCAARGEHLDQRPKVMELRAAWMKQHGLDESDFEVVVAAAKGRTWGVQNYAELDGPVGHMSDGSALALDIMGPSAPMLARVAYVSTCLASADQTNLPGDALVRQIACAQEPVDASKAYAEIDQSKQLNVEMRFMLRQSLRRTFASLVDVRAQLAALAKSEPAVAQLTAIAAAERKAWAAPSPARKQLLALVDEMEDATVDNKRSAFAGCEAKTRAAWADVIHRVDVPKVNLDGVYPAMIGATFQDAEAYLAHEALELCASGNEASIANQSGFLGDELVRRGPRTSTIAAFAAAAGTIKFDRRDLEMPTFGRPERSIRSLHVAHGTLEKVAAHDGKVEVIFKKVIVVAEGCVESVSTGEIERISDSGVVETRRRCVKRGPVQHDVTPPSLYVSPFLTQGLTPGMTLFATEDGLPLVATASAASTKAIWLLGVTLK